MSDKKEHDQAVDIIADCYNDKQATINGRDYDFMKCNHFQRLKVFAYASEHAEEMQRGKIGFMGTGQWREIQETIEKVVNFNDSALSKLKNHWEEYPEDYMQLMTVAIGVISYPFSKGSGTS